MLLIAHACGLSVCEHHQWIGSSEFELLLVTVISEKTMCHPALDEQCRKADLSRHFYAHTQAGLENRTNKWTDAPDRRNCPLKEKTRLILLINPPPTLFEGLTPQGWRQMETWVLKCRNLVRQRAESCPVQTSVHLKFNFPQANPLSLRHTSTISIYSKWVTTIAIVRLESLPH